MLVTCCIKSLGNLLSFQNQAFSLTNDYTSSLADNVELCQRQTNDSCKTSPASGMRQKWVILLESVDLVEGISSRWEALLLIALKILNERNFLQDATEGIFKQT